MAEALNSGVIQSALDAAILVELLATDFLPRTQTQIAGLVFDHGHAWSSTKLFNLLSTLKAAGWARKDASDLWSLSPQFAAMACAYYESIVARSNAMRSELTNLEHQIQERINHATK